MRKIYQVIAKRYIQSFSANNSSVPATILQTTSSKHSGEMISKNDYHTSNIVILCTVKREAKEKIFKSAIFFNACINVTFVYT